MSKTRISLGKYGEDLAAHYIIKKGLKLIARNYKNRLGEVDIIAQDGDTLVFIEVKTRSNYQYGSPEEAVTTHKQRQISRVAAGYLVRNDLLESPARFDVITVMAGKDQPKIKHIISAFEVS